MSDIDLVVVSADAAPALRRRWERLCRVVPLLGRVAPHVWIYGERELAAAAPATCLTYGLGAAPRTRPAAYLGAAPLGDPMGLLARPGLYGPAREWRLVAGPDRRPAAAAADDDAGRRIAAWLEVSGLWRYAYEACVEPSRPHVPYLCVKLVADPVRVWLYLTRGETVSNRAAALERGRLALPDEEESLAEAAELLRSLPHVREAPLARVLPVLVRLSDRIARRLADDVADAGATEVRLLGAPDTALAVKEDSAGRIRKLLLRGADPLLQPLVDWRSLAMAPLPDEIFTPIEGDPSDPAILDVAARAGAVPGEYPALRAGSVLLFPTTSRSLLRTIQCELTAPAVLGVAEGREMARFPNVAGWSAQDTAARAVAEHQAWLLSRAEDDAAGGSELGVVFTAARAALFFASLEAGEPELALSVAAVAELLVARAGSDTALDALDAYRGWRRSGPTPPKTLVRAFEREVRALPAFAGSTVLGGRR